jgi:hypothetical protein
MLRAQAAIRVGIDEEDSPIAEAMLALGVEIGSCALDRVDPNAPADARCLCVPIDNPLLIPLLIDRLRDLLHKTEAGRAVAWKLGLSKVMQLQDDLWLAAFPLLLAIDAGDDPAKLVKGTTTRQ